MSARAVLFALSESQADKLSAAETDVEVMQVIEEIEEAWEQPWVDELDKAWDSIHRVLTDGKLEYANGTEPLNHAILGGYQLYNGDDYIVSVKDMDMVKALAVRLLQITELEFKERYLTLEFVEYDQPKSEDDLEYAWSYFVSMQAFYQKAAEASRDVIFTVAL